MFFYTAILSSFPQPPSHTVNESPSYLYYLHHASFLLLERPSAVRSVASVTVTRTSCSPAETLSEALVHVAKKPKTSEEDDLEEGEIRSEEEDDDTEKKTPVMQDDEEDDSDEEEQNLEVEMKDRPPRSSVQDAQGDDGNQNKEVLVNITSKTEEVMVSQGPEEAFTDDGKDVSPHECQKIINSSSGLPEDDGVREKEGPADSCITYSQSSPCEQSETSQIEGQENMHGDNTDVYSSASENQANM